MNPEAHQRLGELPVGALEGPEEGPVTGEEISAQCRLAVDQQLAHPGGLRQHLIRALCEARLSHEQRHPAAQSHRQQGEEDRGNQEGAGEEAPELDRLVSERREHRARVGGRSELDGSTGWTDRTRSGLGAGLGCGARRVHVSEGDF